MIKTKTILTYLFAAIIATVVTSCMDVAREVEKWAKIETTEQAEALGKYHFLEDHGINLFLPAEFEEYSIVNYQRVLDSLSTDKESSRLEVDRINALQAMDGGFYLYFEENTRATCSVNTMNYNPISKGQAKQLLGIMRLNNEKQFEGTDINYTKVAAKYNGTPEEHIFKSIHKISSEEMNYTIYNATYIVTSNRKTVLVQISTPFLVHFDPFILKLTM